ncbi:hypothetical protein DFH08DRAFT_1089203 [Mycena albidolilacea]|uniref:BHLH domain-containing protein n=1 Tax=Mycena albidolilacea TaxID=1033008 RepID=A0AAD7EA16_9AGAR|nr:hypothetical protein DFH08DRAFT_1089203 [Mycena albidolilacea]
MMIKYLTVLETSIAIERLSTNSTHFLRLSTNPEQARVSNASPASTDVKTDSATPANASGNASGNGVQRPKRRLRRANTAERHATHNTVERMGKETLNGRFLTLASMLPPRAALRYEQGRDC